jgi:hypothetical protein
MAARRTFFTASSLFCPPLRLQSNATSLACMELSLYAGRRRIGNIWTADLFLFAHLASKSERNMLIASYNEGRHWVPELCNIIGDRLSFCLHENAPLKNVVLVCRIQQHMLRFLSRIRKLNRIRLCLIVRGIGSLR